MRATKILLTTEKKKPKDSEIISHQYMIRAGLIRQLASGIYTWLPIGIRVLQKIKNIVRNEMNKIGSNEIILPSILPAELLKETGRWEQFGPELLKFQDRNKRNFCYGPTHEEPIVDIARKEIKSYKQLPLNLYQIQTKFRDEIRPRFGIMRAREFIMKDAYSFHTTMICLEKTYNSMYQSYNNILKHIGINFRVVKADSGKIGGNISHEFQVLAKSGEDTICYSNQSDYAANIEIANYLKPNLTFKKVSQKKIQKISTYNIDKLVKQFDLDSQKILKTLIIRDNKRNFFALVLCRNHTINMCKIKKLKQISPPFYFATLDEVQKIMKAPLDFIGPIHCKIPIIIDYSAAILSDFICGANENHSYYIGANWKCDVDNFEIADLRNVMSGDLSPDGVGKLEIVNGIEVGHIFQLGSFYSNKMNVKILDKKGKKIPIMMGCYGFGISRVIAASIEQSHDDKGIIWPQNIAPFDIIIIPIYMHQSSKVAEVSESIYIQLKNSGFDVLIDDRKERPGVMFADADLIGIPHHIIIGEKQLQNGNIEYKFRKTQKIQKILCNIKLILAHISKNKCFN